MQASMTEQQISRLSEIITLLVGMKTMVTMNVATDMDLANGSMEEITDNPREPDRKKMV